MREVQTLTPYGPGDAPHRIGNTPSASRSPCPRRRRARRRARSRGGDGAVADRRERLLRRWVGDIDRDPDITVHAPLSARPSPCRHRRRGSRPPARGIAAPKRYTCSSSRRRPSPRPSRCRPAPRRPRSTSTGPDRRRARSRLRPHRLDEPRHLRQRDHRRFVHDHDVVRQPAAAVVTEAAVAVRTPSEQPVHRRATSSASSSGGGSACETPSRVRASACTDSWSRA